MAIQFALLPVVLESQAPGVPCFVIRVLARICFDRPNERCINDQLADITRVLVPGMPQVQQGRASLQHMGWPSFRDTAAVHALMSPASDATTSAVIGLSERQLTEEINKITMEHSQDLDIAIEQYNLHFAQRRAQQLPPGCLRGAPGMLRWVSDGVHPLIVSMQELRPSTALPPALCEGDSESKRLTSILIEPRTF